MRMSLGFEKRGILLFLHINLNTNTSLYLLERLFPEGDVLSRSSEEISCISQYVLHKAVFLLCFPLSQLPRCLLSPLNHSFHPVTSCQYSSEIVGNHSTWVRLWGCIRRHQSTGRRRVTMKEVLNFCMVFTVRGNSYTYMKSKVALRFSLNLNLRLVALFPSEILSGIQCKATCIFKLSFGTMTVHPFQ